MERTVIGRLMATVGGRQAYHRTDWVPVPNSKLSYRTVDLPSWSFKLFSCVLSCGVVGDVGLADHKHRAFPPFRVHSNRF